MSLKKTNMEVQSDWQNIHKNSAVYVTKKINLSSSSSRIPGCGFGTVVLKHEQGDDHPAFAFAS